MADRNLNYRIKVLNYIDDVRAAIKVEVTEDLEVGFNKWHLDRIEVTLTAATDDEDYISATDAIMTKILQNEGNENAEKIGELRLLTSTVDDGT